MARRHDFRADVMAVNAVDQPVGPSPEGPQLGTLLTCDRARGWPYLWPVPAVGPGPQYVSRQGDGIGQCGRAQFEQGDRWSVVGPAHRTWEAGDGPPGWSMTWTGSMPLFGPQAPKVGAVGREVAEGGVGQFGVVRSPAVCSGWAVHQAA